METGKKHHFIYFVVFILSLNSFFFFSYICQYFSYFTTNQVIGQVILNTLFIIGLSLSALIFEKMKSTSLKSLINIELIISILILTIPLILGLLTLSINSEMIVNSTHMFIVGGILFVFSLLNGLELPALIQFKPKEQNYFLFFNYLGALIASFLIALSYRNETMINTILFVMATLNFFIYLIVKFKFLNQKKLYAIVSIILFSSLLFVSSYSSKYQHWIDKSFFLEYNVKTFNDLKGYIKHLSLATNPVQINSPYQKIEIVPASIQLRSKNDLRWGLFLDKQIQFFSDIEIIYHQTMSYFPQILKGKTPNNILILGGGDLGLARELLKNPLLKNKITVVELDSEILKLSKENYLMKQVSQYDFIKNDVKIVNTDAIQFLRNKKQKYDLIFADFPFPTNFNLSKLYTKEFYKLLMKSLSEDGSLVLDFPIHHKQPKSEQIAVNILLNTLKAAGFNQMHIFGLNETFVYASPKPFEPQFNYSKYATYLDNFVLTNLTDRTKEFQYIHKYTKKINTIFKPAYEFRIEKK